MMAAHMNVNADANPQPNKAYLYVLLSHTGTMVTRMFKLFTKAPYNHATLAFDAELNELYSFGRRTARNPLNAGFVQEDVYEGTYRHFRKTSCKVLRLEVTAEQKAAVADAIKVIERNKASFAYNYIGLLGVLLNRDLKIDNAYFCSQFVAEALLQGGVKLWDSKPTALVTPDDFRQHSDMEVLYTGGLYDYPELDAGKLYQANIYTTRTAALKVN
ncbi:hypothetical protein ACFQZE_13240 [Paenibacillus sp. GCM10027627]|uniref:hypothetical protein n=1 Tax=unclassified Paenibacillus TaxID=185978 RepID=UPI003629C034